MDRKMSYLSFVSFISLTSGPYRERGKEMVRIAKARNSFPRRQAPKSHQEIAFVFWYQFSRNCPTPEVFEVFESSAIRCSQRAQSS